MKFKKQQGCYFFLNIKTSQQNKKTEQKIIEQSNKFLLPQKNLEKEEKILQLT